MRMTKRQVVVGSVALVAYVLVYQVACLALPEDWTARTVVSDIGFVLLEAASLVLCSLAAWWAREDRGRRVWVLVALWVGLNLFADSVWAYYEVLRQVEVPSPGVADVGYLASYVAAFAVVIVAAREVSGRLRLLEIVLDASMFTLGVAAIGWPLVLGPLLTTSGRSLAYWVNLAYPIADLLIIFAVASFFLASVGSSRLRLRPYYTVLCLALLCQTVSDSAYLVMDTVNADYSPGSWLDPIWLLAFALGGVAALLQIRKANERPAVLRAVGSPSPAAPPRLTFSASYWRILIPYVAVTMVAGMLIEELARNGWKWGHDTRVLAYLGFALVVLILVRQYVTLTQNWRLNSELQHTSSELESKVEDLADVNQRLEALHSQSNRLNTLRDLREVAEGGLELACSFAKCPVGWISMRDEDGAEVVLATRGYVGPHHPGTPKLNTVGIAQGLLRAIPLEIRGDTLGAVWLVRPAEGQQGPDLLPVIATHVATALDNAKRYQEAVHLAERDPLTGLFNHRGIHRRLAGEALRAQQGSSELSLIMMDLDDFKALNDTYGHPAGDLVLRQVSDAVRSVLRHADLAGRVGGDELLIVLPNTGADGALQLSDRLRSALVLRPYVTGDGENVPVQFSLGIATYPGDAQSLGGLIEAADANLYASKQRGGNATTGSPPETGPAVDAQGLLGVAGKLLSVVGAGDHYTRRHSEHVALYALSLGEALGLPEESLSTLHVAAMLHDVGKIGVPEDLLHKPGPLDAGEEDMVQRHVDLSAAVISDMPRLAEVARAVQAHHEHHDGTGYPNEVSGNDIPLLARILAVADAYSAMTLERPYRKSMTREQARAELLKVAGTQLDPVLVHRFVEILDAQAAREVRCEAEAS